MDALLDAASANVSAVRVEGQALGGLAAGHLAAPVPTCSDWSVGDLLAHTSRVHRWAAAVLRAGERVRGSELPGPPDDPDGLLAWYGDGLAALLERLEAADPAGETWTFGASGDRRAGWWMRRMAQETAMHRFDAAAAAHAAGGPAPARFEPGFAAAGVEEYLADLLPNVPADRAAGLRGSLHLHATDVPGEWYLDLADLAVPARREHARADTAVRGPAADLLLWLWNRQPAAGHLEVLGDAGVVDAWTAVTI